MTTNQLRDELEHTMQHAIDSFPTSRDTRLYYLIGALRSLIGIDVKLANRFIRIDPKR